MAAATYDLYIEQGATFRRSMVVGYRSGELDPVTGAPVIEPYDLTGCQVRMHIRATATSETVLLAATTETGEIVVGGTDGKLTITFQDEQTDTLTVKKAVYDLEIEYPSGDVQRVLEGKVTVSPNVTR